MHTRVVYINNGKHDNSNELPDQNLEGPLNTKNTVYTHANFGTKLPEEIEKLEYIYKHFQDCETVHELDPDVSIESTDNTIYPNINNDIEYS